MLTLDGTSHSDTTSYLLGALALSAITGQPFEMVNIAAKTATQGLTPFHLTACQAIGKICDATIEGHLVQSKQLRFTPRRAPHALELEIDTQEITGQRSPASVTPLAEALIPILAQAEGESFIRLRGANTTPFAPSAFWLRETLTPTLTWTGINASVEVEKWGWYPEGRGEMSLLVQGKSEKPSTGRLVWQTRGDPISTWALVALSPRLHERIGQQMSDAVQKALTRENVGDLWLEVVRVPSYGSGSALFLTFSCEQIVIGVEGMSYRGQSAQQIAKETTATLIHHLWHDAAFDGELASGFLLPVALLQRNASFTASELTPRMSILADIIPQFLPVDVQISNHATGNQITIQPIS